MNSLVQITIVLTVLSLVESTDAQKGLALRKEDRSLCNIRCYATFPTICASDGKTYHGLCELTRARCRSKTSIKFVKLGKCPTCQLKEPIRCIVPACFFPSCPAYPKAICVSFCACKSEFYYQGRRVNCSPITPTNPCNLKFCGNDGICKVVNGKAVCVSKGAVCSLPKVVGPCRARFLRYYFNTVTQKCENFYYGGCRSNGNNFRTKKLCEGTCKPDQDVCSLPAVQGPCEAHIERYFYNVTSSKCEKFYYGGCQGNKNNFKTFKECEKKCKRSGNPCDLVFCGVNGRCKVMNGKAICISSENPCLTVKCSAGTTCGVENGQAFCRPGFCLLPSETGPCKASMPRYFYNKKTGKCERFIYGGCRGNKNNFLTLKECNNQCKRQDTCPSGKPLVNCLVAPCQNAQCPAHPKARCVNNYCGECKADFYVGERKVDCNVFEDGFFFTQISNDWGCQGECYLYSTGRRDSCAQVSCNASMECRVILGEAICRPVLANPCIATTCLVGTRCVVVNGEGRCIPVKPLPTVHPLCAAVSCLQGTTCIVRNGRPLCATPCSSSRGCKQQGSFCNLTSGICQCRRFCAVVLNPVCGSDGRRYGNKCHLDVAACRKRKSVTTVPCYGK